MDIGYRFVRLVLNGYRLSICSSCIVLGEILLVFKSLQLPRFRLHCMKFRLPLLSAAIIRIAF